MRLRPLVRMALALGVAVFPAVAGSGSSWAAETIKPFDPTNTQTVIGLLADTDAALSPDGDRRTAHWQPVARPRPPANTASGEDPPNDGALPVWMALEQCTLGRQLAGAMPGVLCVSFDDGTNAKTDLALLFADTGGATVFRAAMDARFGASDPACSDQARAHWSLSPGLSLKWAADAGDPRLVTVSLLESDPVDANCTVTSSPRSAVVDPAALEAFLKRLKADPPPWTDVEGMRRWLGIYGEIPRAENGSIFPWPPVGPPGLGLSVNMKSPSVPGGDSATTVLHLIGGYGVDMFAEDKVRKAITDALGQPYAACSDSTRTVWVVDANVTLALMSFVEQIGILITNGPVTALAECR